MLYYLLERIRARRRKAAALREIRRNGWRCPWLGDGRIGHYLINRSSRRRYSVQPCSLKHMASMNQSMLLTALYCI